ncbi:MAG: DMT family transporter [Chloroflexota bacterium]
MKNLRPLLILVPGIIWGVSFVVTELILPYIPPISLTLIRALISVVMLFFLLNQSGGYLPKTFADWRPFLILGLLNQALPFTLTAWGQRFIDSGLATILISTMPLFTVLIAHFFTTDEKLNTPKSIGILLGLAGIIVLIGPEALSGIGFNFVAQLAVVASALSYSMAAVYTRFVYPMQPEGLSMWALRLRITLAQFIGSLVILLPLSLLIDQPWTIRAPISVWLYMLFLGIGVTMLATLVYFYLIETMGAGKASTTIYLIPVSGIILGVFVLGEVFTLWMGISLALILAGITISSRG